MQGTWVQSVVWEDAACCRAAETRAPQLLKPSHPGAHASQQEKSLQREAQAPQLEKTHTQQQRPRTAKNKYIFKECWRGCGKKCTSLQCWWECKLRQPLRRALWRFLKKPALCRSQQPRSWAYIQRKAVIQKGTCHPYVHNNTVDSSEDMETTWMAIDREMEKKMWCV